MRILLPTSESMVEAAHIVPFSESGDEDLKWHVSPVLDDRYPDFAPLVQLHGKRLIGPVERWFTPRREALELRMARLRRHAG